MNQEESQKKKEGELSPSILRKDYEDTKGEPQEPEKIKEGFYSPKSQEYESSQESIQAPTEKGFYQPEANQRNQPYENNYYQEDNSYAQPAELDTDTILEIAEQVFYEKIKKVQKNLETLNQFKELSDSKLKEISNRLKRIENTIDNLQISILKKIGSYGENLEGIKKEMSMIENSFGKIVSPTVKKKKYSKK